MARRPTRDRADPDEAPVDAASTDGSAAAQSMTDAAARHIAETSSFAAPDPAEPESGPDTTPDPVPPPESPEDPPLAAAPAREVPSYSTLPVSEPRRSGGGTFAGLVLGGALAAVAGAAAVIYLGPDAFGISQPSAQQIALLGTVKTQGDDVAALKTAVDSLRADLASAAPSADLSPQVGQIAGRMDDAATALAELTRRLDSVEARLAAIQAQPVAPASPGAGTLPDATLGEVRKLLDTQRAEAEAARQKLAAAAADAEERIKAAEAEASRLKAESEAAARQARARAAVSHLQAALESGAPIQPALDELAALDVAIPPALAEQASGVPSLGALKSAFPPAARESLALSLRETAGTGTLDRFLAFLRVESGARSLAPRAGDDPDAVLSRAEAALGAGDLPAAVAEIGALPSAGQTRMAEWVALAQRRIAAVEAVKTLTAADQGG